MTKNSSITEMWMHWQKMLFRFFFAYFLLFIFFWPALEVLPGLSKIHQLHSSIIEWVVETFNSIFLDYKTELVANIGGTDTSFGWVQQLFCIVLAIISMLVWTCLDFKKNNYQILQSKLRIVLRYFIAMLAFGYGIMKLCTIQMPSPSLSELSTPVGDLSPYMLSWLFFGHSAIFQIFLGAIEITVGFLLFYKRTYFLGVIIGFCVFFNIMMLNFCFDIDAKIISINLVLMCSFILFTDFKKIKKSILHRDNQLKTGDLEIVSQTKRSHYYRIILKSLFILLFFITPLITNYQIHKIETAELNLYPIPRGIYDVKHYILNNDTIPVLANDSIIWKDFIFDKNGLISINSKDTILQQYNGRGYLYYTSDTINKTLKCYKYSANNDSIFLFSMQYHFKDKNNIHLSTRINDNSVQLDITKSKKRFQLLKNDFNWVIDTNK